MYEMYPPEWRTAEWGPAKHYAADGDTATVTLDQRDETGDRPDDN